MRPHAPASSGDAEEDSQWRWDERDIDGGFSGCEFPRLWPPRRHLPDHANNPAGSHGEERPDA